jgi:hypothetical protein
VIVWALPSGVASGVDKLRLAVTSGAGVEKGVQLLIKRNSKKQAIHLTTLHLLPAWNISAACMILSVSPVYIQLSDIAISKGIRCQKSWIQLLSNFSKSITTNPIQLKQLYL